MHANLEALVAAAVRAPSGDNTQPWRFVLDCDAQRIAVCVDEARDPSPMNSGQRMARIAIGAASENLLRTIRHRGWQAEQETPAGPALVMIRLIASARTEGLIDPLITARVTNRRLYDGRLVPNQILEALEGEAPVKDNVRTHWICGRDRLCSLGSLIGRADAAMFGEPNMRRAFLSKVRFDAASDAEVAEGLSLASLELSAADRISLRLMSRTPNWLLKLGGAIRVFAAHSRRLVESSSGLCLVVAEGSTPQTDLVVGQAMQRAWLSLTANGLAVQPMMSLAVLENVLEHGTRDLLASLGRDDAVSLGEELRELVPEIGDGRPAALLRFGFAPPPSGRTGRLSLEAVTTQAPLSPRSG